jgi:hypothetical protein
MAARHAGVDTSAVIQAERRGAVELLQQYTRLKRDAVADEDLGWAFLADSLIFKTEARVRWLDACEARLARSTALTTTTTAADVSLVPDDKSNEPEEVLR